jgi:hypothetical protein
MPLEAIRRKAPPPTKGRVLVIDDEVEISAKASKLLLDMEGYEVDLAQNAAEGEFTNWNARLRSGAARPDDAGPLRHGGAAGGARARPRDADLHDHGVRIGGSRGHALKARRQRLLLQALGQREADDRDRAHDRRPAAGIREHQLKRALKQRYSFPNIIGKSERMVRCWTWWRRWRPAARPF